MIFYFTGTGNSLFAAKTLLLENERLVNIADAIHKNEYIYTLGDNESLGFVFPVYFYTVPTIIEEFINKLSIANVTYVYAVITCGGGISQAGAVLKKILSKNDMRLCYVTSLLMPDNSVLYYNIPGSSEGKERIEKAKIRLGEIKEDIQERRDIKIGNFTIISSLIGQMYKVGKSTKKFNFLNDRCNGCGNCVRNCPEKAICLSNNSPKWIKKECSKCSACINGCPMEAIQYGKGTIKRNRYYIPTEYR